MKLNEIFFSIDGEGIRAGELSVFIRLTGCNLRCRYCDTRYAFKDGAEASVEEIVNCAKEYGVKNVTLTGGEPLIHEDAGQLVDALVNEGMQVNIETNGTVDPKPYMTHGTIITMDYKTAASGENSKMHLGYIKELRDCDVLKFVMEDSDFDEVESVIRETEPRCWIYLSPVFNKCDTERIVEFMKRINRDGVNTDKMRVQLQLHKYIWNPQERGV